jgi:LysR family glycine cleavage system transcriptional activator
MSPRPPPLALLRTFEAAARHLSFKKAAAELHVTPAAISQQIKALEAALGVPLFQRLTRALRLSERGAAMLPPVQQGLACLSAAIRLVQNRPRESVVLLTAPPSFATHWLMPRLPDFYASHPGIEVQLSSSSTTVDRVGDSSALDALARADGDDRCALAILYGSGSYGGFRIDELMTPHYLPVCAPGLLAAARPALHEPGDLLRQVLIHDETLAGADGGAAWGWAQWLAAAGVSGRSPGAGRRFSNTVLAIEAAVAGQGVALAARALVSAHLAAGTLVLPFDLPLASPSRYWLVGNENESERPAVAGFRQWLLGLARGAASGAD